MAKPKYRYVATNRNGPGALFACASLWEVLRFAAHYFKEESGTHITIHKECMERNHGKSD